MTLINRDESMATTTRVNERTDPMKHFSVPVYSHDAPREQVVEHCMRLQLSGYEGEITPGMVEWPVPKEYLPCACGEPTHKVVATPRAVIHLPGCGCGEAWRAA